MDFRRVVVLGVVGLAGVACEQVATCENDAQCAEWRRSVCQAMDISGTWTETGRAEADNSALVIENENDGEDIFNDVMAKWVRTRAYDGEQAILDEFLNSSEQQTALGTLYLGDDEARSDLGDNLSPRPGVTRLVAQSRVFGCRPTPPQRFCEVRYVMMVEGEADGGALHGDVEVWKETQTAPLERTITRVGRFPVAFNRPNPLVARDCPDAGN